MTARLSWRDGLASVAPLLIGVIPFGLVYGATAADGGLSLFETSMFSWGIFAGASQIAAVDLLADGAPVVVAAGTALIINSRMLLYSASLSPFMAAEPPGRRVAVAYLLTDQAYAVSLARFEGEPEATNRFGYFLGAGLGLWSTWQTSSLAGALVGEVIPEEVPVKFAVPLVFLVLLIPAIKDRPTAVAAVVSGTVAVLAAGLPSNAGMPLAAVSGIAAGFATATVAERRSGSDEANEAER